MVRSHHNRELYSSKFLFTTVDQTPVQLMSHKAKKNKVVLMISSAYNSGFAVLLEYVVWLALLQSYNFYVEEKLKQLKFSQEDNNKQQELIKSMNEEISKVKAYSNFLEHEVRVSSM